METYQVFSSTVAVAFFSRFLAYSQRSYWSVRLLDGLSLLYLP